VDVTTFGAVELSRDVVSLFFTLPGTSVSNVSRRFYSASVLLAMQSAVLATPFLSVCPSVRHSVTFRRFVQKDEDTIVRFTASRRTILPLSGEVKFIGIFAGDHP